MVQGVSGSSSFHLHELIEGLADVNTLSRFLSFQSLDEFPVRVKIEERTAEVRLLLRVRSKVKCLVVRLPGFISRLEYSVCKFRPGCELPFPVHVSPCESPMRFSASVDPKVNREADVYELAGLCLCAH